jgi:hypothetical protein
MENSHEFLVIQFLCFSCQANSTCTTLACSRGIQLIGPHFMYWILSMFKVQLASRYMYNLSDSQATGQMERPISLYVMQHVVY